jgi:HAD superfamily hydrolase (TIGR01509 family)
MAAILVDHRTIEGIIFDIDGTLVNSFPVYCSVFNIGIGKYRLKPVPDQVLLRSMRNGQNLLEVFRGLFPPNTEDALLEECRKTVLDLFIQAEVAEVKFFPGVENLFWNLNKKGLPIGVATGRTSPPEREWDRFKRHGLDRLINAIVTSREVERRKPAPDVILECAKRLDVAPENCLVVGDTEDDVAASRGAGAIAAAVSTGLDAVELLERARPDFLFKTLLDLDLFLAGLPSNG